MAIRSELVHRLAKAMQDKRHQGGKMPPLLNVFWPGSHGRKHISSSGETAAFPSRSWCPLLSRIKPLITDWVKLRAIQRPYGRCRIRAWRKLATVWKHAQLRPDWINCRYLTDCVCMVRRSIRKGWVHASYIRLNWHSPPYRAGRAGEALRQIGKPDRRQPALCSDIDQECFAPWHLWAVLLSVRMKTTLNTWKMICPVIGLRIWASKRCSSVYETFEPVVWYIRNQDLNPVFSSFLYERNY